MAEQLRIALVVERQAAYFKAVVRGIIQFARPAHPWVFHRYPRLGTWTDLDSAVMRAWKPHAVVVQAQPGAEPNLSADLAALKVPAVDISTSPTYREFPYVGIDHQAVGRMVGSEFLNQGLRHIAYLGWDAPVHHQQFAGLRSAFTGVAGATIDRIESQSFPGMDAIAGPAPSDAYLAQWVSGLPKPVGIMLCDDDAAAWVTQACTAARLRVPEDVALIGVYDDENNCLIAYPPLSSVEVPGERVGYEVARLLEIMTQGQQPARAQRTALLPPVGIVTRGSSDLIAADDPDVALAARFIRQNAHRPLRVMEVQARAQIGPRRLEQRFKQLFGRTIAAEIVRVHVERAAQLLVHTNLAVRTIAKRSGFSDAQHLCHAFRRVRGKTPGSYRREFAVGPFTSSSNDEFSP